MKWKLLINSDEYICKILGFLICEYTTQALVSTEIIFFIDGLNYKCRKLTELFILVSFKILANENYYCILTNLSDFSRNVEAKPMLYDTGVYGLCVR